MQASAFFGAYCPIGVSIRVQVQTPLGFRAVGVKLELEYDCGDGGLGFWGI